MARKVGRTSERLVPNDYCIIRLPLLLAARDWLARDEEWRAPTAETPEALRAALVSDQQVLGEHLREVLAVPGVEAALLLASPELAARLPEWCRDPLSTDGRRLERALCRYIARASFRATPFGMFAALGAAAVSAVTQLELRPSHNVQRRSRVDLGVLHKLLDSRIASHDVRDALCFVANPTVHRSGERLHYVESAHDDAGRRHYRLATVADSAELRAVLDAAAQAVGTATLSEVLARDGVPVDDAQAFVEELVEANLLLPTLAIPLTSADPTLAIIAELGNIDPMRALAERLAGAQRLCAAADEAPLTDARAAYASAQDAVHGMLPTGQSHALLQTDVLLENTGITVGRDVVEEACLAAEALRRITPPYDELREFARVFAERYEEREVPLLEVTDEEIGIGIPEYDGTLKERPDRVHNARRRQAALTALLVRHARSGDTELVLSDADLATLSVADPDPLPSSVALMATLAPEPDSLGGEEFRLVWTGAVGPPAPMAFGRFCNNSAHLRRIAEDLTSREKALHDDIVFAEVVHLPHDARAANVLARPSLHDYEIPYLGRSGVPQDRQIPVSDLLVSVRDGEIILRSRRLGRRVVPRLTTMHNYHVKAHVPLYRFLGLLQQHRVIGGLGWSWGNVASLAHLPRVRIGKTVVARAQWRVERDEVPRLKDEVDDTGYRRFAEWRASRGIPRWALLVDGDNQLPVDLATGHGILAFQREIAKTDSQYVHELYPVPDAYRASNGRGRVSHELIIPLVREIPSYRPTPQTPREFDPDLAPRTGVGGIASVRRHFVPGTEWLYWKLYGGAGALDLLVREELPGILADVRLHTPDMRWFFVRYADPQPHLRVRVHLGSEGSEASASALVSRRLQRLLDSARLWRVQQDTYSREVERYGGYAAMAVSEEWFHADSELVLAMLNAPESRTEEMRHLLAIQVMHGLIGAFGRPERWCIAFLRGLSGHGTDTQRQSWGARYRTERSRLQAMLSDSNGGPQAFSASVAEALLAARRASDRLAESLAELDRRGELLQPVERLIASYTHMHVNRLLRGIDNRSVEPMLYDLLRRAYDARQAQAAPLAEAAGML